MNEAVQLNGTRPVSASHEAISRIGPPALMSPTPSVVGVGEIQEIDPSI